MRLDGLSRHPITWITGVRLRYQMAVLGQDSVQRTHVGCNLVGDFGGEHDVAKVQQGSQHLRIVRVIPRNGLNARHLEVLLQVSIRFFRLR